jgi:putative holliday junction resolvase
VSAGGRDGSPRAGDGPGADHTARPAAVRRDAAQPPQPDPGPAGGGAAAVPALTEPVRAVEPAVVVGAGEPAVPAVGARLGVDVGSVRVGIAVSDPRGVLATPLETVARDVAGGTDLNRLADLVVEHGVVEVIVGLPRSLSGRSGPAAQAATEYATALAARIAPVPVRLSDERLTTVAASRTLSERGISGRKQRTVVDQAAAVLILQGWLDTARTGR